MRDCKLFQLISEQFLTHRHKNLHMKWFKKSDYIFFSIEAKLKIAAMQGTFCSVSRSEKLCNSAYTLMKFAYCNIYTSMIRLWCQSKFEGENC